MVDRSISSRIVDYINLFLLIIYSVIALIPFLYIIAGSFSTPEELVRKGFVLIPTKFTLDTYKYIFSTSTLTHSLLVTIYITVLGTITNLLFTVFMAYPLAGKSLVGRRTIMILIVFTMLFSGGMIPTFLIVKSLGLLNSYWAIILPGAISAFNLIILISFFKQLPEELEESAKIDGCGDLRMLFQIVLPLSLPALATFSLFYAVGHWNTFFSAILYVNDSTKWPIQVLLRQIVILSQGGIGDSSQFDSNYVPPAETIKMAAIVVSTVPILIVYPFLQKHFAKGVLLGSIKG
jgi:putative aldouronate transport system permease protein